MAERETVAGVQLIGVGRYEPGEEPDTAEVAFVEDGWQGRGLGGILLEGRVTGLRFRRAPADATPR